MSTDRLNNIKPIHVKEDEQGNKFVLLSEDDYRFLREKAERVQELEHDKERVELIFLMPVTSTNLRDDRHQNTLPRSTTRPTAK